MTLGDCKNIDLLPTLCFELQGAEHCLPPQAYVAVLEPDGIASLKTTKWREDAEGTPKLNLTQPFPSLPGGSRKGEGNFYELPLRHDPARRNGTGNHHFRQMKHSLVEVGAGSSCALLFS